MKVILTLGTIRKMMRDNKLNTSFNIRSHYANKYAKGTNSMAGRSHVGYHFHGPSYSPNDAFTKGDKGFVTGVKNPFGSKGIANKDVIMHELGHAKDFATHGKLKTQSIVYSRKLKGLAPLMLLNDKTEDYAVPTAAALELPTLRAEAAANYHAYKGIKAHKGVGAARGFLKKVVVHNTLNYGAAAAMGIGGVYLGKKIKDKLNGK